MREEVLAQRDVLHAGGALAALQLGDPVDEQEPHDGGLVPSVVISLLSASRFSNRRSSPDGKETDLVHAGQMNSGSVGDSFIRVPHSGQCRSIAALNARS